MLAKIKKFFKLFADWEENKEHVKWMLRQISPYKLYIVLILLISFLSMAISYASTIIGKYVVDDATSGTVNVRNIVIMCLATAVSILIGIGTKILSDYINEKFSFGMRLDMFSGIQRSIWMKISKFHSGDLVTRLTSDVSHVSSGLISLLPSIITIFLQFLLSFGILYYYDKYMALFALIIAPIGALCMLVFREKYKVYQTQLRENESSYRSFMQDTLANLTVMKSFMREGENDEELSRLRASRLKLVLKSSKLSATMSSLMRLVYSMGYVGAFCWGAYRIKTGDITYGTLTIFISLVSQVQNSVKGLANIVPQFYSMLISTKRIREVSEIENEQYNDNFVIPESVGIRIDSVRFAYETETVLSEVSASIAAGEKVGVVGSSGAGKTTLIRLLLALVQPDCGEIAYIDENGISETASPSSRRFISYVPQGNTLVSGTIRKNLLIGKADATNEEMLRALEIADATEFIAKLPRGLGTELSEKAGGLSEGQAQRISIARALLSRKPMLILDEATSALDERTESQVLRKITESTQNTTCIIITHRRSMLQYCTKVIEIFDDGSVIIKDN